MQLKVRLPDHNAQALPRLLEAAPALLEIRKTAEDFRVDELLPFEPDGDGEHLFLRIQKRGLSTPGVVRRFRDVYGVKERDVGVAGRKDAQGVTSQHVTVPASAVPDEGAALEGPDLQVLLSTRHRKKLRLGFLRANRFVMRVEGLASQELKERLTAVSAAGFPNYFGQQRFGVANDSLREAERFVGSYRPARGGKDRFLVSTFQSALFNRWLSERVADGLAHRAVDGDLMGFVGGGTTFFCEDEAAESLRVQAAAITHTGPLHGPRMRRPERTAMTRESRSLVDLGIDPGAFDNHPAFSAGDRRHGLCFPQQTEVTTSGEGTFLAFELPPGSYATVLMEELSGGQVRDHAFGLPSSR